MGKYVLVLFFFSYIYQFDGVQIDSHPVVLWHGMGDSCCFSFSLGRIKKLIENRIPDIYVYSIRLGNNEIEDVENSYFGNINEQIQEVCQQLLKNERLKNGYNAIGFSQGAQFLRAVIQRCPNPPVKNFISLGGQHQGVFGLPNCGTLKPKICNYITRMIKYGAYLQAVQGKFIQATYWHDPYQEEEYKKKSMFMADINNERYINERVVLMVVAAAATAPRTGDDDAIRSGGSQGGAGVGCWVLGAGCWMLVAGCWVLGAGCWVLGAGCWVLGAGCWVLGVGCWCHIIPENRTGAGERRVMKSFAILLTKIATA
ncbi:palmitoyl-protein thioesterase 1 isoform X2 [Bombus pyrosoma]|uniref:palmitoyl-protein thioesterase 1 isoform X2 n=1 Tax=Bombus pyrosoma TaxID=396416 RepID=UPI001CB951D4|nr:palmitoyl-protein thioesterase 1 isoform X2 [Bombus pyrosoma]